MNSYPFAYIFAGEGNGIDIVTHPIGYTGTGGVLTELSTQNVVNTINSMLGNNNNLIFGAANNIPGGSVDFESTLLHEMGHSLGLAHVNAATESGLAGADRNYTRATDGADNVFNIDDGTDNVIGSEDDVRGDDVNLNFFKTVDNDPFSIAGTIDETTYSRNTADLPTGDLFSTNPDRDVADLLFALPNTEASMQQGAFFDEDQRLFGFDDAAGLLYASAGLDEIAGNADDYTLVLCYIGLDATADIVIDFDNNQTGFAVSQSGGAFIGTSGHIRITANDIFFNTGSNWFFNTVSNSTIPAPPAIGVTNSVCVGVIPMNGTFTAPTSNCPVGYDVQYSTDNGVSWSTTLPTYNQTTAMTVLTRCNRTTNAAVTTPTSSITTMPAICTPMCPTVTTVADDTGEVCDGGGTADLTAWQASVITANPASGPGTVVFSSVTPVVPTTPHNNILPTGNHSGVNK